MSSGTRAPERGHRILPHTADAGVEASGPTLAATFEEAAAALGELTADLPGASPEVVTVDVALAARDREGLLVAWLNELIGLGEVHHAALLDAAVGPVDPSVPRLAATVRLVPFAAGARPRVGVKSATFHRVAVGPEPGGGWRARAYLDV